MLESDGALNYLRRSRPPLPEDPYRPTEAGAEALKHPSRWHRHPPLPPRDRTDSPAHQASEVYLRPARGLPELLEALRGIRGRLPAVGHPGALTTTNFVSIIVP